jgi:hypothetical protein
MIGIEQNAGTVNSGIAMQQEALTFCCRFRERLVLFDISLVALIRQFLESFPGS